MPPVHITIPSDDTHSGAVCEGGTGVEWYFGARHPHNNLTLEDSRTPTHLWKQTRNALTLFEDHLPYWKMVPMNDVISDEDAQGFGTEGEIYAIYPLIPSKSIYPPYPKSSSGAGSIPSTGATSKSAVTNPCQEAESGDSEGLLTAMPKIGLFC